MAREERRVPMDPDDERLLIVGKAWLPEGVYRMRLADYWAVDGTTVIERWDVVGEGVVYEEVHRGGEGH